MTLTAFENTMSRLAGLKFAPATMQTHYDALKDLTQAELDEAVTTAGRECDEFPSPRQLRSFVRSQIWHTWTCPHEERCDNREKCRSASILGRPERRSA